MGYVAIASDAMAERLLANLPTEDRVRLKNKLYKTWCETCRKPVAACVEAACALRLRAKRGKKACKVSGF